MKRFILALAACALLLTGCGGASQADAGDAVQIDPLTGLENEWPGQRPAAVVVHNGMKAESQWGIADASVVLEALTEEYGDTALCLVYPAVEAVPKVGPVAQGQDLYWQLLSAQQVIPVERGANIYAANFLDITGTKAVDAHEIGTKAFRYEGSWGVEDEVCWYTNGRLLAAVLDELSIDPTLPEMPVQGPAAESAAASEESAARTMETVPLLAFGEPGEGKTGAAFVDITFSPSATTGDAYTANEDGSGSYRMLRGDGSAQADADTGAQAAFDNILVLYSAPTLRDDGYTWGYDLTMGGGVYLNGGEMWSILWMQGADSTLAIYANDGTSLSIRPGTSYIALLGSVEGQQLTLRDENGATVAAP